jgi:protein TonB
MRVPSLATWLGISLAAHGALVVGLALAATPAREVRRDSPTIDFATGASVEIRLFASRPDMSRASSARVSPMLEPFAAPVPVPAVRMVATKDVTRDARVLISSLEEVNAKAQAELGAALGRTSPTTDAPLSTADVSKGDASAADVPAHAAPSPAPGVDRGAAMFERFTPEYPARAVRLGQQGTVRVEIEVLATGDVGAVRLLVSSGSRLLDDAALRAAERGRYRPGLRNGQSIRSRLVVPFVFEIR